VSISDGDLVIEAARAGAAILRAHYGSALTKYEKAAGDFATTADIEAERAIRDVLHAARPDDLVVGEEGGRSGAGGNGRMWLVDPLCGTRNYVARTTLVSVNVALHMGTQVLAAASADPFTDEVFWTDGVGASVRNDDTDQPLAPSAESGLVDVNVDPPFPNRPAFVAARLLADERFVELFHPRVVSSTLAVAWVAAGRRAGYVTDGRLRDNVHFAAGIAICQAAGCLVTALDGKPLHTGMQGLVAAADERTHTALVAVINNKRGVGA
jgi:myo-inositol-1(or 4)-monophosphatase